VGVSVPVMFSVPELEPMSLMLSVPVILSVTELEQVPVMDSAAAMASESAAAVVQSDDHDDG
jgi:hypothetical protein